MAMKPILERLRQSAAAAVKRAGEHGRQSAWLDGWLSDWQHGDEALSRSTQPKVPAAAETNVTVQAPSGALQGVAAPADGPPPHLASESVQGQRAPQASTSSKVTAQPASAADRKPPGRLQGAVNVNAGPHRRIDVPPQTLRPANGRLVNGRPVNLEAAFAPQLEKDLSKEKRMPGDPTAPVGATPPDTSALNKQIVQAVNFTNYQNLANAPAMVITPPEMSVGQTTAIAVQDAESYMNAIMQIAVAGQAVAIKKAAQGPAGELIAVPLMAEIQAMVQAAVAVYGSVSTTAGTSASTVIGDLKTAVS